MMIYVPNLDNYKCVVVYDKDTIRAYEVVPNSNSDVNYVDIFVNSHYMTKSGVQRFSQYYNDYPTCLSNDNLTTNIYYRSDMPDILLMFLIFCIFCFLIPLKIFGRMFRRYL